MAKRGYEGVLSTDPDQQARALRLFIADMLAARRPIGFSAGWHSPGSQLRCL